MSDFKVRVQDLFDIMDSVEQMESILQRTAEEVKGVRRDLRLQIRQRERLDSRLTSTAQVLETHRQSLGRVVQAGRKAAEYYQDTEYQILNQTSSASTKVKGKLDLISVWKMTPDFIPPILLHSFPIFSGSTSPEAIKGIIQTLWPNKDNGYIQKELTGELAGSVSSGSVAGSLNVGGLNLTGEASGAFLSGRVQGNAKAIWNWRNGDINASAGASAEGSVLQGQFSYDTDFTHGEGSGKVLSGVASGTVAATLWKDGELDPSLNVNLNASGSVLSGELDHRTGTDDFNTHMSAKGDVLSADARAGVKVDKNGVSAEAGAEAYVAKGEISGGINFFGIKIDTKLEGKALGAGVEAKGSINKDGASGKIGAGLGLGAGVEISIDWSDAFWNKQPFPRSIW